MAKSNSQSRSGTQSSLKPKLNDQYKGFLIIGDPHLEGRQPGFRSDDFPQTVLKKLEWCLDYAKSKKLLPTLLGDIFDKPRDNPTWMIGRLIEMMSRVPSIGIYGNHDCADPELNENDSLSILIKAGCIRLVSEENPWRGIMNDRLVFVGGSSYRQKVPYEFPLPRKRRQNLFDYEPFVMWLTHHDISMPGYEAGKLKPHEIENVSLLINGHIHRKLEDVQAGETLWITPGNITRRSRSDACKEHVPSVLQLEVQSEDYTLRRVEVPHKKYDEVFHSAVTTEKVELASSEFVSGLAELNARKTQSGAGLHSFLAENISSFDKVVADEILALAHEVTATGEQADA